MGSDFSALLLRPNLQRDFSQICATIAETAERIAEPILTLWKESGFRRFSLPPNVWQPRDSNDDKAPTPARPTLDVWRSLHGMFYCGLYGDSIYLYHILRFRVFAGDIRWQEVMVDSCRRLLSAVEGSEGLITYDESPIVYEGFWRGLGFADSVQAGMASGAQEISSISEFQKRLELEGTDAALGDLGFWRFS